MSGSQESPAAAGPDPVSEGDRDSRPMSAAEFRTITDWLGLRLADLAWLLDVQERTIRSWRTGRYPVPDGVRDQILDLDRTTNGFVARVIAELRDTPDPVVVVYASDADYWHEYPQAQLPASWHRQAMARVRDQIPGVRLRYPE